MGVRVDAARHDVGTFRIDDLIALEIFANGGNAFAFDEDVRCVGSVCGHNGAALDDCRHYALPLFKSLAAE